MAQLKIFGAIMVALFAIGLDTAAGKSLWEIGKKLGDDMDRRLSPEDQADAEKAFSLAKEIIGELNWIDGLTGGKLLKAWDRILHRPDQCNESSLEYIATIEDCGPHHSEAMRSLTEATRKYARKCFTPDYITNKIELETRGSGCFSTRCSETKDVKFIDDQLIADYWSEHPEDMLYMKIDGMRASEALAKAVIRGAKQNIKDFHILLESENEHAVHAYLKEHLYKPCSMFEKALRGLMTRISFASPYFEGGYRKLIPSLDKSTQNVFFRYKLCTDIRFWNKPEWIDSLVVSDLRSLSAS